MNFSVFLLVYAFSVNRPPAASSRTAEHQHRSHRYEAKRQEIEAWLMRMESRSERMGNAEAQADVLDFGMLDSQQKEQKVRVSARFSSNFTVVRHDFSSAVFMLAAFFRSGIWNSWVLSLMKYLWAAASSSLSIIFLSISELPRRTAHLQAPHRVVQSINSETHCRLPRRRHDSHQTHDGDR